MNDKDRVAFVTRIVQEVLESDHKPMRSGSDEEMNRSYYAVALAECQLRKAHENVVMIASKENEFLERQLKGTEEEVEALRETVKHVTNELEDARAQRDIAGKSAKRLLAMLMSVHHRLPGDVIEEMLAVRDAMKEAEKK